VKPPAYRPPGAPSIIETENADLKRKCDSLQSQLREAQAEAQNLRRTANSPTTGRATLPPLRTSPLPQKMLIQPSPLKEDPEMGEDEVEEFMAAFSNNEMSFDEFLISQEWDQGPRKPSRSPPEQLQDPDTSALELEHQGQPGSMEYRIFFKRGGGGARVSPWHDIPLRNKGGSLNFICEVPKWTRAKFQIATTEQDNPIKQETKKGKLRCYDYGDVLFNYGAFPQTWEDPSHESPETNAKGDNDPLDAVEIGVRQRPVGSVTPVKVLGSLALIAEGQTDWKVVCIACDDPLAPMIDTMEDVYTVLPNAAECLRTWMQSYKTAGNPNPYRIGFDGEYQEKDFTMGIVDEMHKYWTAACKGQAKLRSRSISLVFKKL